MKERESEQNRNELRLLWKWRRFEAGEFAKHLEFLDKWTLQLPEDRAIALNKLRCLPVHDGELLEIRWDIPGNSVRIVFQNPFWGDQYKIDSDHEKDQALEDGCEHNYLFEVVYSGVHWMTMIPASNDPSPTPTTMYRHQIDRSRRGLFVHRIIFEDVPDNLVFAVEFETCKVVRKTIPFPET